MNEKLESIVMSSENVSQESQFSASSSIRRKVDVLNLPENGNFQEHALPDSKCNLRMSLAWDSAFFTSPGVLEPEELFLTLNSRNLDNVINILGNEEHLLLSSQSLEPDTNSKVENFNSRKSLAWDNGFLTSEGVLDPFELAIVNNGFKQCESHLLPANEDEVWRSMESHSTLDSEGFSLTRLEMDLFEDIGASMPKPTISSFELGRGKAPAKRDGSQTVMQTMPACRRQSTNKHGSKRITGEMPDAPKIQLKHTTESREHCPSSFLKPPKALEQANCTSRGSSKRTSLGEKHFKLGSRSGISASDCLGKSKKPCLRDSCNAIHGSTQLLKSSLSHYPVPTNMSVSRTTSSVCRGVPSDITMGKSPPNLRTKVNSQHLNLPTGCPASVITIGKSPPNLRRKVNSQRLNLPTGGPASVTPLVKTRANKMKVESSCQPAYLEFTPTSSSYGSPSSSTDEWSSESSSTSAAQRFVGCKPSPYTSLGSSRLEVSASEGSHLEPYVGHETSGNQRHRENLMGSGNAITSVVLREIKPSGLRMPSPKLGFFDEENKLVSATKRGLPKGTAVAKSKGAAYRTRSSKLQSPRSLPGSGSKRSGPRKNGGTVVSHLGTRRTSDNKNCLVADDLGSQTIPNRTPTRKPYVRILQCSNDQSLKAQETIMHNSEVDFQIFHDGNKENVIGFVDQIEGLTKLVNSIHLNNVVIGSNEQN